MPFTSSGRFSDQGRLHGRSNVGGRGFKLRGVGGNRHAIRDSPKLHLDVQGDRGIGLYRDAFSRVLLQIRSLNRNGVPTWRKIRQ